MSKLNLACGLDIKEGWTNTDVHPARGVDVVQDLYKFPWQFLDEQFDHILASHFVEHLPRGETFARVMEEAHRVLRPGGTLEVRVPHFANERAVWSHPDHKAPVYPETWDIFSDKSAQSYFSTARFELISWRTSRRCARWPEALKLRGTGIFVHLEQRAPWLRWLVTRPLEATYILRKV